MRDSRGSRESKKIIWKTRLAGRVASKWLVKHSQTASIRKGRAATCLFHRRRRRSRLFSSASLKFRRLFFISSPLSPGLDARLLKRIGKKIVPKKKTEAGERIRKSTLDRVVRCSCSKCLTVSRSKCDRWFFWREKKMGNRKTREVKKQL